MSAPHVAYIVTSPMSARLLLADQLRALRSRGYRVTLIVGGGEREELADLVESGVDVRFVPMEREIAPLGDVRALVSLVRELADVRPDLVNASTPKAALLGTVAATLARVPVRIHVLRGLRLETTRGTKRRVLAITERITSALAHETICVSDSLRRRYLELALARPEKTVVIGAGSSHGVDARRFAPRGAGETAALRAKLGIPERAFVIGFVGRLTRDKGIDALMSAFETIAARDPDAWLLAVGDEEPGDPISAATKDRVRAHPRACVTGFVPDAAAYYSLMDVLAFPSRREGFPNAPLEAAASTVPAVAFRVTGAVDAVIDGHTGALVPEGDVDAFTRALESYRKQPELRARHGAAACERVTRAFTPEKVAAGLERRYRTWLRIASGRQRGLPLIAKRAFDVSVAGALAAAASPVMLATAGALAVSLRSPSVVFRQERPGRAGRSFTALKFRTMNEARDASGALLPDAERLTRVGRVVRSLSLDELPQLWNVLRGEMSLVGPRPLLLQYIERYSDDQARRHDVLPGITGWAQVHGRNAADWDDRLALDVWYVDHWSLALDVGILARTIWTVLRREGISEPGQATRREFMGSAKSARATDS